jgi:hypothetical protein
LYDVIHVGGVLESWYGVLDILAEGVEFAMGVYEDGSFVCIRYA